MKLNHYFFTSDLKSELNRENKQNSQQFVYLCLFVSISDFLTFFFDSVLSSGNDKVNVYGFLTSGNWTLKVIHTLDNYAFGCMVITPIVKFFVAYYLCGKFIASKRPRLSSQESPSPVTNLRPRPTMKIVWENCVCLL